MLDTAWKKENEKKRRRKGKEKKIKKKEKKKKKKEKKKEKERKKEKSSLLSFTADSMKLPWDKSPSNVDGLQNRVMSSL